jgi:4-amino-4-deoxy-L-arabinose transferase-like glycosyltransferase
MAWRPVAGVAAAAAVIHLVVAARFGWHHDEFYYVICGRHLAFGYVDQPPLAPLLARLAAVLPGGVFPLRLPAIAAQIGCVLLAPMLAAEFGGRRRAQVLAAAAVAACPVFVAASMLFGTTVLDQLAWVALFVLTTRALRTGAVRSWLAVGVVAGLGLETKDTIAVLMLGIAMGLALYRRETLRTAGPWLAGALAVALALPNLVWDAQHGWPNVQMAHALAAKQGGPLAALAQVPLLAIVIAGPPLVALWIAGVRQLCSTAGREHRWVLVVAVVAVLAFTAAQGKSYYAAPALAALFAAGAVRVENTAGVHRLRWPAALAVSAAIAVLFGLPVLPAGAEQKVNVTAMQTYGWPQLIRQVAQAAATIPASTPVFTSDYGEAGALTILGPAAGLHNPVYSGHNNYTLWGPPPGEPDTVLCVGKFKTDYLHRFWSHVTKIAPITTPGGITTQETTAHAAIYLCRQPLGTWAQMWPHMRHFD